MRKGADKSEPWFKFYPRDWRGESSLRAVSMAARGLWMEMLCLMHEAQPRGHLLLNGRPVTDAQLATLAGVPVEIAQALLGELETAGTFSRTRAGVIYSRRMRKDTATSDLQRDRVNKRWAKEAGSDDSQPPEGKGKLASGNTKRPTERIPKKPEARDNSEPKGSGAASPPSLDQEAWDRAVRVLSRSGLKETSARSFFGKLLKEHKLQPRDLYASLVQAEVNGTPDPQSYLAAAAKHVGQRVNAATGAKSIEHDDDFWRAAVRRWRADQTQWTASMGPQPGEPGCLVPQHLLIEKVA